MHGVKKTYQNNTSVPNCHHRTKARYERKRDKRYVIVQIGFQASMRYISRVLYLPQRLLIGKAYPGEALKKEGMVRLVGKGYKGKRRRKELLNRSVTRFNRLFFLLPTVFIICFPLSRYYEEWECLLIMLSQRSRNQYTVWLTILYYLLFFLGGGGGGGHSCRFPCRRLSPLQPQVADISVTTCGF